MGAKSFLNNSSFVTHLLALATYQLIKTYHSLKIFKSNNFDFPEKI